MEYKVLYRKYRPDCFKNIIGQDYTVKMLQNAIINKKISHAYLFTGPRGTGKTSTAKVFAKTINCENIINGEACGKCKSCLSFESSPDIIEIDAASNNGVDDIRELINNVKIAPTEGKYKIYIIDEVHMMTASAFNALLLTLEEPPAHAIFIMATTNVENVPITILSRCQRFNFHKISLDNLKLQIKKICELEKIEIEEDAINEIAYLSEGGMRDALSLLDQLASNNEKITIDKILENYGSISLKFIDELISNIENKQIVKISNCIHELENSSSDYKVFIKKLILELAKVAVNIKEMTYDGNLDYQQIQKIIFDLNDCMNKININTNPFILIELIILNHIKINDSVEISLNRDEKELVINKENKEKVLSGEPNLQIKGEENNNQYLIELKKIRVNNCFVGAKKDITNWYREEWVNLKTNLEIRPEVLALIMDAYPAVASNDYCIIMYKLESMANIVNNKLDDIAFEINKCLHKNIKLMAVTENEWKKIALEYKKKMDEHYEYQLLAEESINKIKKNNKDNDEVITNIFNHDKIEMI